MHEDLSKNLLFFFFDCFFFQAEDGIRDRSPSRGLGDVYKRQIQKPGACDEQGGSAPEKEAGERRLYLFMDMYRRVVRHRFPV